MGNASIEKIKERISKLKEKTGGNKTPKEVKTQEEPMPEKKQQEIMDLKRKLEFFDIKTRTLEHDKEELKNKLKNMILDMERLNERTMTLESEKKELLDERATIVEKIENQERENWIRFSLGIIESYINELFRYLKHAKGAVKEAIDLCLASPKLNESLKKKVDFIGEIYKRTLQLVEQSKIKFSFPQMKKTNVLLEDVVNDAISYVSAGAGEKIKFNVKSSVAEDKFFGDRDLLSEMFSIIFQNSIESIQGSGNIGINISRDRDNIGVEVSDTGCGISPHLISKVFNPFFTTKNDGLLIDRTGLGLTRAYWICHLHGGEIEVESQLNRGTKIKITLPQGDKDAAS